MALVALVPDGVVTVTSTAPAACAGDTALMCELSVTEKLAAGVPPKLTAVAPVKLLPAMVTDVPPVVGPEFGLTLLTLGAGATNVNWSAVFGMLVVPFGFATVTSTVPAASAGDVAVTCESSTTEKEVAAVVPNLTAVAPVKPVPVMFTVVPPAVEPEFGLTLVIVGQPPGGRHWEYADVVGPPVPTRVAEMPSVCGSECGTPQVVAASPSGTSVAVVVTTAT